MEIFFKEFNGVDEIFSPTLIVEGDINWLS